MWKKLIIALDVLPTYALQSTKLRILLRYSNIIKDALDTRTHKFKQILLEIMLLLFGFKVNIYTRS